MTTRLILAVATLLFVSNASAGSADSLLKDARQLFKPLPANAAIADNPLTPEKVELGRKLFFDPRFSADGTVSCVRCHLPQLYATDGLPKAIGVGGKENPRNSPSILNAALQAPVHWRGDRATVEEQALKSPLGPAAFGLPDHAALLQKINAIPGYRPLFERVFPGQADPVTPENWSKAIGAYERTLMAPAPFDDFLKGKRNALSRQAQAGLRTFMSIGCSGCHNGVLLGGAQFQKFGLYQDYWTLTGSKNVDHGRFDVTKNESDQYVFKVPGLRNVAMTSPYFHDGSVAGLPTAVKIMAKAQLDRELSDEETANIVAFLESLTGKMPRHFIEAPILPPSVGQ